jgi:hypothetical protein
MNITLLHVGLAEHQATDGLLMPVGSKSMNAGQLARPAKMYLEAEFVAIQAAHKKKYEPTLQACSDKITARSS